MFPTTNTRLSTKTANKILASSSRLMKRSINLIAAKSRKFSSCAATNFATLRAEMSAQKYDVAIIGGGPAGSTAATLLAKAGRRVIVFEREKFPRFHIGESLLPASMRTFDRLGVQEKLRANFIEKFGGEMSSSCSEEAVRFYFEDGYGSQVDRSYQVTRADFDKVLLDHAAENGAEVREETTVQNI